MRKFWFIFEIVLLAPEFLENIIQSQKRFSHQKDSSPPATIFFNFILFLNQFLSEYS